MILLYLTSARESRYHAKCVFLYLLCQGVAELPRKAIRRSSVAFIRHSSPVSNISQSVAERASQEAGSARVMPSEEVRKFAVDSGRQSQGRSLSRFLRSAAPEREQPLEVLSGGHHQRLGVHPS